MARSPARKALTVLALSATLLATLAPAHVMAAAPDPAQARKELKAMGVDYNGQEFAKAAGNGDMTAVNLFLAAGMDVNEGGGAALGLAAGRGRLDMVKHLLSKGAKPTANALQYARTRGHKDIEKVLVEAGAKE
ncbi:MAG: ankyrin repeat domain-containing protein [Dechloromonas sp.]|jgi:ankyrin repeat protein|nr:ankyrin repeat domain-containing protein [Dechloromonas sp.]